MKRLVVLGAFAAICFSPPTVTAQTSENALLATADRVLDEVARLRELAPTGPIPRGVKTREEIKAFVLRELEKEYPEEKMRADETIYQRLGLLAPDANLHQLIVQLLEEQIVGFYDPQTATLYIASHVSPEEAEPVLAHELVHALQDQHFNLEAYRKGAPVFSDEAAARAAVVEGEGVAVMIDYMGREYDAKFQHLDHLLEALVAEAARQSEASSHIPRFLTDSLMFPYAYGVAFLQALRKEAPWSAVARLYSDPPRSTEQILHPDKYFKERDHPLEVTIVPQGDLADWKRSSDGEFGEYGLRQILDAFLPTTVSHPATEGWGGDRYLLLEGLGGSRALLIESEWDSPEDAREFWEACKEMLRKRLPDEAAPEESEDLWTGDFGGRVISVRIEGTRVNWIDRDVPADPEG